MRKLLALASLFLLLALPAAHAASSGQSYEAFLDLYAENVTFINENTGRHLLPLVFIRSASDEGGGHREYSLMGDVLSATVRLDAVNGAIEMCQIVLAAPPDMVYGSAQYNDFTTSGFHSYALLMAMSSAATPLERYDLVKAVEGGLAAGNGEYVTQVGVYRLTCTRANGVATLTFENPQAIETPAPEPEVEADEPEATDDPNAVPDEEDASLAG